MINKISKTKSCEKNSRGFTLIETLVAITILLLSIVGPMSIAANSLFAAYYGRDQITAYYLSQEGIEYVRNTRDSSYLSDYSVGATLSTSPLAWLGWKDSVNTGVLYNCFPSSMFTTPAKYSLPTTPPPGVGNGCLIDITSSSIRACPNSGCSVLNYDSSTFIYNYDPPTGSVSPSKFTRTITITPQDNQGTDGNEAIIESKVSWKNGGQQKNFTLRERIYNWQRE